MADDNGGPAFPTTKPLEGWGDPNQGMTLRDYFAGQALAGMMAGEFHVYAADLAKDRGHSSTAVIAASAYEFADAMLKERAK